MVEQSDHRCPGSGCGQLMVERWKINVGTGTPAIMCPSCATAALAASGAGNDVVPGVMASLGFVPGNGGGWKQATPAERLALGLPDSIFPVAPDEAAARTVRAIDLDDGDESGAAAPGAPHGR
jgi:hypothetical protein